MDNPQPEFPVKSNGCSDGDANADCARITVDADGSRNYVWPKKEPQFTDVSGGGGDGGAGGDYAFNIDISGCHDPPKEEPEPELGGGDGNTDDIDVHGIPTATGYYDCSPPEAELKLEFTTDDSADCYYDYDPPKQEPGQEFGSGDGYAVDVDGYYDCDPLKKELEPELVATGDDAVPDSSGDIGYDCSHCGINLSTRKFKVEHEHRCKVQIQQKELESQVTEVYRCGYCRCPFLNNEFKEQHQQRYCRKRPVAKRKDSSGTCFECDECKFVTKWKHNLESHILTHNKNNAKWFTCTQCSYKTVHKGNMTAHMKIHGNAFSCCCPICGKSFRRKRCLDDHLVRQHSDEWEEVSKLITSKIYTCNICDKFRTVMKTNFNQHLTITHRKGVECQMFQCPRCPYSAFRKAALTSHAKTHAEQKDYQCTRCKKQFTRKTRLDSHILSYHSSNADLMKTITSKMHRCGLCSFKTVIMDRLKIHIRTKHV